MGNRNSKPTIEETAIAAAKDPARYSHLTAEVIDDRVTNAFLGLASVFVEMEQRSLASNGKAYPLDYNYEAAGLTDATGAPVLDTGDVVDVNKYEFLSRGLARSLCSGLNMIVRQQQQTIERQKQRIQSELRFGRNAGTDVAAKVERMADWLGNLQEQCALVEVAFNKACELLADNFGDEFVTKEQADQVVKARVDGLSAETKAKLAALGIN